jgi:hypothetical protein
VSRTPGITAATAGRTRATAAAATRPRPSSARLASAGRCNAGPADWGQRCNGCGATWACDGTCAGPQPACPPGWYTVANGNCELHQTTGLNLYEKDHPNFTFMTNLFNPKPLEGSYLALSYLRIDYNGGVCFDSDSPDAIQADCTNFSGALTQHDTGSNQSAEGRKYWNVGQSCDLTKLDWWTVFGRDTCNKYANLDAYWQIQPQCY